MTKSERRILETLATKYSRSAHAQGGAPLRLSPEKSFADLLCAGPDIYESFLEAAEKLQADGIISLTWKRYRTGEEISSIILQSPEGLFSRLERPLPSKIAQSAQHTAREAMENAPDEISKSFFIWLAANIRAQDVSTGERELDLCAIIKDFAHLTNALTIHAKDGFLCGITPRALSITLFSDSKRIECLLSQIAPLLSRARRALVPVPDTSAVERNFPETLIAGALCLHLQDDKTVSNSSGSVIGIPLVTATRIRRIECPTHTLSHPPRLLSIENLETFYAIATRSGPPLAEAYLYTGGHPNRPVQKLLASFSHSGFSFIHAGDLDPEGILILQEIMGIAKKSVTPLKMDKATFLSHLAHSRELEDTALTRVAMIKDETRSLDGVEELLTQILETGRGVEQEIITY